MAHENTVALEFFRAQKTIFDAMGFSFCEYMIHGSDGEMAYAEVRWLHLRKQVFLKLNFAKSLALIQVTFPEKAEWNSPLPTGLSLADSAIMGPWLLALIAEVSGDDLLNAIADQSEIATEELSAFLHRLGEPVMHLYNTATHRELPEQLKEAARELMAESADTYSRLSESGFGLLLREDDDRDVFRIMGKMFQSCGYPPGWRMDLTGGAAKFAQDSANSAVENFFLALKNWGRIS